MGDVAQHWKAKYDIEKERNAELERQLAEAQKDAKAASEYAVSLHKQLNAAIAAAPSAPQQKEK